MVYSAVGGVRLVHGAAERSETRPAIHAGAKRRRGCDRGLRLSGLACAGRKRVELGAGRYGWRRGGAEAEAVRRERAGSGQRGSQRGCSARAGALERAGASVVLRLTRAIRAGRRSSRGSGVHTGVHASAEAVLSRCRWLRGHWWSGRKGCVAVAGLVA